MKKAHPVAHGLGTNEETKVEDVRKKSAIFLRNTKYPVHLLHCSACVRFSWGSALAGEFRVFVDNRCAYFLGLVRWREEGGGWAQGQPLAELSNPRSSLQDSL